LAIRSERDGDVAYYGRFAFRPARDLGVLAPDPGWGDALQALELPAYRPVEGPLVDPPEFEETGTL
jgi:predicted N-acetyltransferase YhbS